MIQEYKEDARQITSPAGMHSGMMLGLVLRVMHLIKQGGLRF